MISKTKTKEAKNTTPQFDSHVKEYYKFKKQNKDLHHISWKNHGIDEYISEAILTYQKRKEIK